MTLTIFDPDNLRMIQSTFGNGLIDERQYDLQGRLNHQLLKTPLDVLIDERTYSYDKNSNITNIDTNIEDNAYTYDKLDRIKTDIIDSETPYVFNHDLNDNRLSKTQAGRLNEVSTYIKDSNVLVKLSTAEQGSSTLTAFPDRNLVFNDASRLYQLYEEGSLKVEYIYNYEGQRTRKTVYQADGVTVDSITIYHYDQLGYLISETDEQGSLIKDYIWQEGMTPLAQIDNNSGTESITYLHTDHLMTNRVGTDQSQLVIWRWEGDAFGNTSAQELAGVSVNLRFPGQYYDQETNLNYNWNRYYDPLLGRYITSDPIGLEGGFNTYYYANANPIFNIDSDGKIFVPGILIGGGVGALFGGVTAALTGGNVIQSAIIGATSGAIAGSGAGLGLVAGSALGFSVGFTSNAVTQGLDSGFQSIDFVESSISGLAGIVGGGIGSGIAKKLVPPRVFPSIRSTTGIGQGRTQTPRPAFEQQIRIDKRLGVGTAASGVAGGSADVAGQAIKDGYLPGFQSPNSISCRN